MCTPYLANTIMTNEGIEKTPRTHYNRLQDGVHPTDKLKKKWATKLAKAIIDNRKQLFT